MASINDFKSAISLGGGLAMQNRYRVQFGFPARITPASEANAGRQFNFLCESATIPAIIISTFEYQAQKQAYKIANGYAQDEVSFTMLLTNDYLAKTVFDKWASAIVDFNSYRMNYRESYVANVEIIQMAVGPKDSGDDTPVYGVTLFNAFPTNVSAITLENTAENSVQRLTVSMAYERFEPMDQESIGYYITAT